MNNGFRRLLILLAVFVCAFLAVFVARKIQNGDSLINILSGGTVGNAEENDKFTLRLAPIIGSDKVQVLSAINRESAALVEAVVPSVVSIDTSGIRRERFRDFYGRTWVQPRTFQGQGSGVIVTEEGHVLTNHHVIQGNPRIRLTLHDGTVHNATVIGTDKTVDIAVLKIDSKGSFQALKFGDSSKIEVGHAVFAIGNPFGIGTSVTDGKISAKKRPISDIQVDLLQTSAPINPGNSGGPLVNVSGEIIGINSRIYSSDKKNPGFQGIGFAIPSNDAFKTLQSILAKGRPSRGFLGMALRDLDPYSREKFGYQAPGGVCVMGLAPDSPATKAGLEIDDIIISYQDTAVENMSQLIGLIQRSKINESIALEIWRQGTKRSLQAVIGKAADYNKDDVQLGNNQPESDVKLEPQTILEAIGLYVRDSSPAERAKGVGNVIVSKVNSASPLADKLLIGDQVLAINNHLVQRSDDFLLRLIASAAKQNTELKIRRGNTTFPVIIPQVMSRN
jgi:serine protease Do